MTSIDADIHPQSTIREFSPLTEVHLDQLGASVTTAKPIRKAAGYARLSGWMTLLAGAMSVLISIGSIPGMLLGLGLAAIGMRELGLARKLDGLDLKAPASLAINQLMLGAVLIGYAIFKFATYDSNDSVLAGSLASDPTISSSPQFAGTIDQLSQIEHMLHLGVYALLILIAFVMQGATAVYYIAKRSRIKQLHHHSPDWVLSVHRVICDLGYLSDTGKRVGETNLVKVYQLDIPDLHERLETLREDNSTNFGTVPELPDNSTVFGTQNHQSTTSIIYIDGAAVDFEKIWHITKETDFNDLILKSEYAEFLEKTSLEENCPNIDLTTTEPGQYKILESQISQLHHQTKKENNKNTFEHAAKTWCKEFYIPVIEIIRERGILRDFSNRTETDLFAWILRHQKRLQQDLGWNLEAAVVATDIADRHGNTPSRKLSRVAEKFQTYMVPEILKTGPRPGKFRARQEKIHAHDPAHLFTHLLIPLTGEKDSWQALELGLRLAWREEAHLLGLHIIPQIVDRHSKTIKAIQRRFKKQCQDAGIPGEMAVDSGPIVPTICRHARLSDLVIIHLAHPPDEHPIMRAGSGIRKLIQQSPRPILTIPQVPKKLERLLVAYNGNPRSREALYAAAYFAGRWEVPLYILTVAEPGKINLKTIDQARYYLGSRQIPAKFIQKKGDIAKVLLEVQAEQKCSLIFTGGYSKPPVIDVVMGSPLDQVLRESPVPVLICR